MKKLILFLIVIFIYVFSFAQSNTAYEKKLYISGKDTLRYRILYPLQINPKTKYPLLLFLHGSGERGNDNELQLVHGGSFFADSANRKKFPAFVIFPQCPLNDFWSKIKFSRDTTGSRFEFLSTEPMATALRLTAQLIDSMAALKNVDGNEIYIGGLSMGGFGTYELLWRKPHFFAAAFPICGAGDTSKAHIYGKNFPIWVFHGDADPSVNVNYSRIMVSALKRTDAKVKYSEYAGVGHDSWNNAFAEPELLPWLFSQHK